MFKRILFTTFILCLSMTGVLLSYMLTEEYHYGSIPQQAQNELALFSNVTSNVCGEEDSFMSCTAVTKSKYSTIGNIPVAALGIMYYGFLCCLIFIFLFVQKQIHPAISVFLFWTAIIGSLVDVALLIISIFLIDSLCPMCLSTYVCTWLCLIALIIHLKKNRTNPFRLFRAFKTIYLPGETFAAFVSITITVFILLVCISFGYGTSRYLDKKLDTYIQQKDKEALEIVINKFSAERNADLNIEPLLTIGIPNAPITIVEFSDFLCSHCSRTAKVMDELVKNNPSKVKIIFINYPLDITCNHYMKRAMHTGACLLAAGAVCAAEQNGFTEYQRIVFSKKLNSPRLNDVKNVARLSGLNVPRFIQCIPNPEPWKIVLKQIEESKRHDVHSTPTIFINNKRYKGRVKLEWLQKIVDMELERIGIKPQ